MQRARGVVVDSDFNLTFGELELRELGPDDVLIKVHSAPINPADLGFSKGKYPAKKPLPNFVGFEGSGLVIKAGSSEHSQSLLGQRVSFFSREPTDVGTWGEQTVVTAQTAFPIPGDLSYEEGSVCLVNPLSAQAFVYIAKRDGHKTLVHSAAASALGKMLVVGCKQAGLNLICLVRKEEQVAALKEIGAEHILNSSSPNFEQAFAEVAVKLGASAFFDAVSGKDGSRVVSLLPPGTITYCYGRLSNEDYSVSAADLIFKNKQIKGFWLTPILKCPLASKQVIKQAFENLATRAYKTHIAKTFPHEHFKQAIEYYSANQSEGKVLLQNPHF